MRSGGPFRTCIATVFGSLCVASLSWAGVCPGSSCDGPAELPRTYLDTTLATNFPGNFAGYVTKTVCASGCHYTSFQTALNNIHSDGGDTKGEIIRLGSGQTFTGNFTLPAYSMAPGKWIVIRTNVPDSSLPPEGERIDPSYSPVLAKLISTNASPTITTVSGAAHSNHYWFMGVEFGVPTTSNLNYELIQIGNSNETSVSTLPDHIFVDRCFIYGNATGDIRRGVEANGIAIAVINSHIREFHDRGADAQAICSWNSPGPFKIVNNYLEGSGENVMFGGADSKIANLVPQDIEIRFNYFFKPTKWYIKSPYRDYAGIPWVVKNLLEFKNAQRMLVEGNVFENNWGGQGQSGWGIVVTPRNQNGANPWVTITDLTYRFNFLRHSGGAVNLSGADDIHPSLPTQRVSFHDNIFEDLAVNIWNGTGWGFQNLNGGAGTSLTPPSDLVYNHNTGFSDETTFQVGSRQASNIVGFEFTNNIFSYAKYGFKGDSTASGNIALSLYYSNPIFQSNVLAVPPSGFSASSYPPNNSFPSSWGAVQFVNFNGGKGGDYHLSGGSPYKGAASDATARQAASLSTDIGADNDAVILYTCYALTGIPSTSCTSLPPSTPPPSAGGPPPIPPPPGVSVPPIPTPVVFPNPWRSDRHTTPSIRFDPLPSGGNLRIFTISGHLVRDIPFSGSSATWDLTDKSGTRVASGIYLYLVVDPAGQTARGRLAIIR